MLADADQPLEPREVAEEVGGTTPVEPLAELEGASSNLPVASSAGVWLSSTLGGRAWPGWLGREDEREVVMRRTVVLLVVVGMVLSGGVAAVWATNGSDTVTLCANRGGDVSWPGEGGVCKKNETTLSVASADALAALQGQVGALQGRVDTLESDVVDLQSDVETLVGDLDTRLAALETLLNGVTRPEGSDRLDFPGPVHATFDVVSENGSLRTNGGSVFSFSDVFAAGDVKAARDVVADVNNDGSGRVKVGPTPLNVP